MGTLASIIKDNNTNAYDGAVHYQDQEIANSPEYLSFFILGRGHFANHGTTPKYLGRGLDKSPTRQLIFQ